MQNKSTEIDHKTTKNLAKIYKIEVWRGSGQLLGASGRQEASQMLPRHILNASGEALEPILVDFGVSWGRLGAKWESPRGVLWRSWSVLGAKN